MKRIVSVLLVLIIILLPGTSVHAEVLDLDAPAYILVDPKTGQVLAEKNADQTIYPASITKLMTAIIAVETGDLSQVLTANQEAIDDIGYGGMNIGIMVGEEIPLIDLLHALLISSANEAANIIADNLAPSCRDFLDLMNAKAKSIGAVNTHFVNPSGMHDDNHYSTVRDIARIAMYAYTKPVIRDIVAKRSYQMPVTNKHESWDTLRVTNRLFGYASEYYTQVTGMKTGYTNQAGNNLVSTALNEDGLELMAVVCGVRTTDPNNNVYTISRELLEYGFKNYSLQKLVSKGTFVKRVPVENSRDQTFVDLVTQTGLEAVLPNQKDEWNLKISVRINPSIKAPLEKGEILGYVDYERNGVPLGRVNLIASQSAEEAASVKELISEAQVKVSSAFPRIFKILLYILIGFAFLRFSLKKISRAIKVRKHQH